MNNPAADIVAGFLKYLKQEKVINLLPEIINLLNQEKAVLNSSVRVMSAKKLDKPEISQIENKLRTQFGVITEINYEIDPELLGGVKIMIGDRVLDLSLAAKLAKIYEQI